MQNGYRWSHQWCLLAGYRVRSCAKQLNWKGGKKSVSLSWCQGTSFMEAVRFVWQIKRNGICINSCIDGHSTEMSYCGATHSSGNANLESKKIISFQQLTKEGGRGIDYKDICILYCQPELQKYIVLNIVQTLRHKAIVEIHNL